MNSLALWEATNGRKMWHYDEPIYFWGHSNNYGFMSNWYPCTFKRGTIIFNCVEQYMMWRKARVFNDGKIADAVMLATEPREHKRLGRQVMGFDPVKWDAVKITTVLMGLALKFSQNEILYQKLMATGRAYLVEASPYDNIWGAGLDEAACIELHKKSHINHMPGQNLLGMCLCYLRDEMFGA